MSKRNIMYIGDAFEDLRKLQVDWEDFYYTTSTRFWKEIERRRGRPTLSHKEIWNKLLGDGDPKTSL